MIAHVRTNNGSQEIQTIKEHIEHVAEISSKNANKMGLANAGELIGLLHDIGKYSQKFQKYIGSATRIIDQDADDYVDAGELKGTIDHSTAGAQFVWNNANDKKRQQQIAAQVLSLCIASHHSGLIDCITPDGKNNFSRRMCRNDEETHLTEVLQNIENELLGKQKFLIDNVDTAGSIIQLIKKIALTENSEKSERTVFQYGLLVRMLYSCLIDADRLDTADFENPKQAKVRQLGNYVGWNELIKRLELHLTEFDQKPEKNKIDDIRMSISEACLKRSTDKTGVYTLTVPTGGGKTLASLRFALHHARKHKLDRIIYVIPFTSIIDQNAQVVRAILEKKPTEAGRIVMEHHSNLMPEVQNWKNKVLTENWDAPIIYTTSVQLLETLFGGGTRSVRRMHQLANSIIIFDEIQTLPVKTVHLFCNAINYLTNHCHSSIVLCTATQPLLNKVDEYKGCIKFDSSNEIMPDVIGLFADLKRVDVENRIKPQGWSTNEIAELSLEQVKESGSCLVVVNTKKNAQAIYETCSSKTDASVYHLSTSMCPAHRIQKLNEIRAKLNPVKPEPIICISTQLIEAGVDVDFGSVIRFVAGLDSIAQAAGRCNRNGRRKIGKVFIVNPSDEAIDTLVDIKIGKEVTERVLREMINLDSDMPNELLSPKIIERYFQYYFYNRADEMTFPVDEGRDNLLNLLSINARSVGEYCRINGKQPDIYFRQSFKSAAEKFKAIDAPTQGIVVPYGDEGKKIIAELFSQFAIEKQFELLKRAQRYTVNVFPNVLRRLIEAKAIKEVPEIGVLTLSDPRYYHPEFGLSTEITQEYEFLNS